MRKWWVVWPVYFCLMGFVLGASFFFALYGRNVTDSEIAPQEKHYTSAEKAEPNKQETDAALAYYTRWLMVFTGVLAFATVGLGIGTLMLYATGEKQFKFAIRAGVRQSRDMKASVNETRRIGEAQVRAYVDISSCEIFFVGLGMLNIHAHPMVQIIATNTGQSPARNFVWNPTVQYFSAGIGAPSRSLTGELGSNWRNILGVGIAVSQSHTEAAMIPKMELFKFLGENGADNGLVLVRLRVQFEFEDVFDERNTGEAYFSGMFKRIEGQKPLTPWGENQWSGKLTRLHRPSDWPEG